MDDPPNNLVCLDPKYAERIHSLHVRICKPAVPSNDAAQFPGKPSKGPPHIVFTVNVAAVLGKPAAGRVERAGLQRLVSTLGPSQVRLCQSATWCASVSVVGST